MPKKRVLNRVTIPDVLQHHMRLLAPKYSDFRQWRSAVLDETCRQLITEGEDDSDIQATSIKSAFAKARRDLREAEPSVLAHIIDPVKFKPRKKKEVV